MPTLRALLFLIIALAATAARATHNRAGEIIICRVSGLMYEATIITHTKLSAPADRPELTIHWGDGDSTVLDRVDPPTDFPLEDLRRNVYIGTHLYAGPGVFTLYFYDENRNAGVVNIPNSVNQPFAVTSRLVISPIGGHNCSVRFLNSPIQDACFCSPWIHNPAAYDPDGDSLSYELVSCLGLNVEPIVGYLFPNQVAGCNGNAFSMDPVTGTIQWLHPGTLGEYNIAFKVHEWRRVGTTLLHMGYVTRDMQIWVASCFNNPPEIQEVQDTCVTAGTFLAFNVQAVETDIGQSVSLAALGQPFVVPSSPATFVSPSPGQSVTGIFSWATNCSHVRPQPYQVVFEAHDNADPVQLYDFRTINITVVSPPPTNPSATPSGSSMLLNWTPTVCSNAAGYRIYRRLGFYGFVPDNCEVGVPAYTGYSFIGSVAGATANSFTDNGPITVGNTYCYMAVAYFTNGAVSYASEEFCAVLTRQVPVITHVSVGETDAVNGIDTVRWSNAYDLDTVLRPGPYQFKLYRGNGFSTASTLIYTSGLHPFLAHPDTEFIDVGLNTAGQAHVYRVDFFGDNGDDFIGSSSSASSVFISAAPNDEQLTISWQVSPPWINSLYEVYRDIGGTWTLVGTSTTNSFTETGLSNGTLYCYRVRSTGAYSNPDIVAPLLNFSQEVCERPRDLTPPCPPTVQLDNDCEAPLNTLTWNNPNLSCADDTYQYHVYFAETPSSPYALIATIVGAENTTFTHANGTSVAGCYQVTAIDTAGNESPFVTAVCGDNCPVYTLPNIFTPNGDRINDLFVPFPYRGVREIDLQVFNRWGQQVFSTQDPDIGWNGTLNNNGESCPDGVYFYTCTVIFIRLNGDEPIQLKGYLHIGGSQAVPRVN